MAFKATIEVGVIALLLAALAVALGAGASAAQAAGSAFCEERYEDELNQACAAAEKYWDVAVAHGDRFIESSACEPSPSGTGTIGIQHTNLERASDTAIDPEEPESLIYIPEGVGTGRRLLALEYSVPFTGQARPKLFGQEFAGPMPDRSGELPRYRLRVWLYSENPNGLFAEANRREACNVDQLVAADGADGTNEGCHEVFASFKVPEDRVREEGAVPGELTLHLDEDGDARVDVGTFSCTSVAVDGTAVATKFTILDTLILPPDWSGEVPETSRYFLRVVTDNEAWAKAARRSMGIGPDVFAFSRDGLHLDFDPIVGMTGGDYEFTSPDFVLRATAVTDPVGDIPAVSIRFLHQTPQGLARIHARQLGLDTTFDVTPLEVEVTPKPRTLLARLIGCPGSDRSSCEAVSTETASAVAWDRGAVTMTAERDWWNPRHELGSASLDGL